ncbi:pentapeptide repeat-containing protein [Brochothrix thermosphacta]|uniref:pentapeptide repeat-containing protein n=1 Tax=Brochothrix thermosphacta TaxID=2756 RepID=UPI0034E4BCFD
MLCLGLLNSHLNHCYLNHCYLNHCYLNHCYLNHCYLNRCYLNRCYLNHLCLVLHLNSVPLYLDQVLLVFQSTVARDC